MYTRMAKFERESRGIFVENQLVKVFLSKIDKHLIDLALSKIIMNYGGRAILANASAVVEQCDRGLCQYDAINLMSLLVDSSKFWKILVVTARLEEAKGDKTLYYWSCGQSGHTKNDCFFKQKHAHTAYHPKQKPVVPSNNSIKEGGKHLPKKLKYSIVGGTITR